jgi:hypothetical protein
MNSPPHALFDMYDALAGSDGRPPGHRLALDLAAASASVGFACSEVDLWRDVGWVFSASKAPQSFDVHLALHKTPAFLLVVAPIQRIGVIRGLLGGRPQISSGDLKAICQTIHDHLAVRPGVTSLTWMTGGPPERVPRVSDPAQLAWET